MAPNPDICVSGCVNLKTDPQNCGRCSHDCSALAHLKAGAVVSCSATGTCVIPTTACLTGYVPASGDKGCELPRFQPLPFSLGAGIYSSATAISADGAFVVGTATDYGSIFRVFRWTAARDIEDLTPQVPTPAFLSGVNSDGSVLGGLGGKAAFRWPVTGTVMPLSFVASHTRCDEGVGISDDGSAVVGTCGPGAPAPDRAVRWQQSGQFVPQLLPVPPGADNSSVSALSRDGTVVVGSTLNNGVPSGLRWTGTTVTVLGSLAGGTAIQPQGISADGRVVVGFSFKDPTYVAVRWTQATGVEQLPLPVASTDSSYGHDASDDGTVIVGSGVGQALLWDIAGVHVIRQLLLDAGLSAAELAGWTLMAAVGVSADGKVVIGTGTNPAGLNEGWIARLP